MEILLTGQRGRLGTVIARRLEIAGHQIRGFDIADGFDILDPASVRRAARAVETIIHVAGLADDRQGAPTDVMKVNLLGTANVLFAAEAENVRRVIYFSSGKSLGMLERDPDYLPVDDAHRGLPSAPYGLAKWLSEEMCAAFTHRTGIDTICLRPVAVFDDEGYRRMPTAPPAATARGRAWHLATHIHVEDVAEATEAALRTGFRGHTRLLLCASDVADHRPTLDLVRTHVPDVPWRGGPEYGRDSYRSLIDISRARDVLGWEPRHRWPGRA